MTLKEFKDKLESIPDDVDLRDIKIPITIGQRRNCKRFIIIYLGDYRICGTEFIGNEIVYDTSARLDNVADSILLALK